MFFSDLNIPPGMGKMSFYIRISRVSKDQTFTHITTFIAIETVVPMCCQY